MICFTNDLSIRGPLFIPLILYNRHRHLSPCVNRLYLTKGFYDVNHLNPFIRMIVDGNTTFSTNFIAPGRQEGTTSFTWKVMLN